MDYMKKYQEWLDSDFIDAETKEELKSLESNEEQIQDRFYQDLKFGTAGLRGKIGAGTNRMNKYTVALATQGLAQTIIDHGKEAMEKGVAISYDVRHKSDEFAKITAEVLAANGIKVYTYDQITPTAETSAIIRTTATSAWTDLSIPT